MESYVKVLAQSKRDANVIYCKDALTMATDSVGTSRIKSGSCHKCSWFKEVSVLVFYGSWWGMSVI